MPEKKLFYKKEKVKISNLQNFQKTQKFFLKPSFWVILNILGDFGGF